MRNTTKIKLHPYCHLHSMSTNNDVIAFILRSNENATPKYTSISYNTIEHTVTEYFYCFKENTRQTYIYFISLKVKGLNANIHAHHPPDLKRQCQYQQLESLAWVQNQSSWIIGNVVRFFRCSSFDFLFNLKIHRHHYLIIHDVIDRVARLIFL